MQTGESEHYRAYCYFPVAVNRNFELFYIELDAGTSNMSISIRRAHEYVYVMKGRVTIKTPSGITFVCIQVKENSLGGFTADDAVVY